MFNLGFRLEGLRPSLGFRVKFMLPGLGQSLGLIECRENVGIQSMYTQERRRNSEDAYS